MQEIHLLNDSENSVKTRIGIGWRLAPEGHPENIIGLIMCARQIGFRCTGKVIHGTVCCENEERKGWPEDMEVL